MAYMEEKRNAYKVLGNRHLEDLFSITFIDRNSEGNVRGTYLELRSVITFLCIGLMHHVLQPHSLINTGTVGHRIKKKYIYPQGT